MCLFFIKKSRIFEGKFGLRGLFFLNFLFSKIVCFEEFGSFFCIEFYDRVVFIKR